MGNRRNRVVAMLALAFLLAGCPMASAGADMYEQRSFGSEQEFILNARHRTNKATNLYKIVSTEHVGGSVVASLSLITQLPANTYLDNATTIQLNGVLYSLCTWWDSGELTRGCVLAKDVSWCSISIVDKELGGVTDVHELLYDESVHGKALDWPEYFPVMDQDTQQHAAGNFINYVVPLKEYTTMYVNTGNEGGLQLRQKDSSSSASLGTYPNGTKVHVHLRSGGWALVTVGYTPGYMMLKHLTEEAPRSSGEAPAAPNQESSDATPTSAPTQEVATLYVRTENDNKLNLRAKASASSASLGRYESGTPVNVLSSSGPWARVSVGGKTGYMMLEYLSANSAEAAGSEGTSAAPNQESSDTPSVPAQGGGTLYVRTENDNKLNLRAKASASSASLGRYPCGTPVNVLSSSGAWARVSVSGKTGYMMLEYLSSDRVEESDSGGVSTNAVQEALDTPSASAQGGATLYIRTEDDNKLNLRAKASASSASLGRYPCGTPVTLLSSSGAWARVRVGGRTGYMMIQYLSAESTDRSVP